MKKILLQIKNLNLKNDTVGKLYNISISFFEGNIYSLSGLDYSGRDAFLNIIKGNTDEKMYEGSFFIDNKCVNSIKDSIYIFSLHNETVKDWTVSEYIALREGKWFLNKKNKENMTKKVRRSLEKHGLGISGEEKIGSLRGLQRYQIELVRADVLHKKIIIIEDEFECVKYADINILSKWLKTNIKKDMTIILSTYSKNVSYECADIFVCFKKGCIVKLCKKDDIKKIEELDVFVVGNSMNEKISSLKGTYSYSRLKNRTDEIYSVSGNLFGNETFSFARGKIYSLIISLHSYRYKFFEAISGIKHKDVRYFIDRYEQKIRTAKDLSDKKIIAASGIGESDSLAENMSVEDNLLLPSLNKLSPINYIINQDEIKQTVFEELKTKNIQKTALIRDLDINQKICVSMERWIIFRPKVFIIFEPFIHCDDYGLSLIKSYLKRFVENGCTVIIIKSRSEYVEDISDEIIHIS